MATIETRKRQIVNAFTSHPSILDRSIRINIKRGIGEDVNIVYVPNRVNYDNPREGLPLKDGAGYVSIREELDGNGGRLGYLYRFTSDDFEYIACKKKSNAKDDWSGFFNFHYQKDKQHDGPHVSFLHSGIRYISQEIDLNEFLNFIERTFFVNGSKNNALPWHSRF